MTTTLLHGDCRELLPTLDAGSVQCCVTSPPYWGLRRYTDDPREIGQESTIGTYVETIADVCDMIRRVLRDDGTLWINLGDAYANDTKWGGASGAMNDTSTAGGYQRRRRETGLPPKSLIGLPWRVAFALQDRGWALRSDIVWHKPNAMPESVKDRPTRAHEYIFLFAKQSRYFCDMAAIAELAQEHHASAASFRRRDNKRSMAVVPGATATHRPNRPDVCYSGDVRNARTVWRVATTPLPDAHYAAFPDELARRCILAGSRPGDTVLDPFAGSGTVARVAAQYGRNAIGIDLGYQEIQERRTDNLQLRLEGCL